MACAHTTTFDEPAWAEPAPGSTQGCQGCLALGEDVWSHLRMCLSCGYVGCCDSSPHRHSEEHHKEHGHPVMRSFEPGESWRWCYLDERIV
jgi:Isopeptidase T